MSDGISTDSGNSGKPRGDSEFIDPAAATGGNSDGDIRDSAGERFDPTRHSSPDSRTKDGRFRGKRGRKSGGNSSKNRAQIQGDIKEAAQFLTTGLMLFHTSLAAMMKTPELELELEEANGLATSGLTLAAMYDITPDPKLQAMILFASQLGMVYGTRFVAIRARKAQEKKEAQPGVAGVYDDKGTPMGTTSFTSQEWPIEPEKPHTVM